MSEENDDIYTTTTTTTTTTTSRFDIIKHNQTLNSEG